MTWGLSALIFPTLTILGAGGSAPTSALVDSVVFKRAQEFPKEQRRLIARSIRASAQRFGVPESLVLALIQVESSYRRRQVSPVGALGLMQLMPKTGREWARRLGIPWSGKRTLFTPQKNIQLGTAYLAWLLKRFRGDRRLALTAYCHGPGRVRRALSTGGLSKRRLRYSRKVIRSLSRITKRMKRLTAR